MKGIADSGSTVPDSPAMSFGETDSDDEMEQLIRKASNSTEDLETEILVDHDRQPSISHSSSIKRRKEMSPQVSWYRGWVWVWVPTNPG